MRRCVINDCNCNEHDPAPCCLDCGDRDMMYGESEEK